MEESDGKEFKIGLRQLVYAGGAIFALWALSGVVLYNWNPGSNYGTFGDMFGAINALFSGLAFACLIFATLMQREELKLQRKELQLARKEAAATREEIKGQKEQAVAQNAMLSKQAFENTFFQLLRLHNDIVNSIDLYHHATEHTTRGRDCFKVFYSRFKERWDKNLPQDCNDTELERVARTYKNFYPSVEAEIGHYFRSLYNIFKFIDASPVENKRLFTNLVRAQLSSYELTMLFYNCLSELGKEKFGPLVEKYALLKMLPIIELINPNDHKELYTKGAYSSAN